MGPAAPAAAIFRPWAAIDGERAWAARIGAGFGWRGLCRGPVRGASDLGAARRARKRGGDLAIARR